MRLPVNVAAARGFRLVHEEAWLAPSSPQWLRHLEPTRAVALFATRDPIATLVEHRELLADQALAESPLGH